MHRMANYAAFSGSQGGCHRGGFDFADLFRAMSGGGRHGAHGPGDRERGRGGGPGRGGYGRGGGFPFEGRGFPGGPWGGPWGGGGRRGGRARRGDIRTAALLLLAEEPRNGYQIMQELEDRSGGAWRPSPGSVYPALQQLEDEGLIRAEERDGRKLYTLTDEGRAYVERRGDKPAPWEQMAGDVSEDTWTLLNTGREVAMAMMQLVRTGSEAQRQEAQRVLARTRRDLYRLLADGDEGLQGEADLADDDAGDAPRADDEPNE